MEKGRDMLNREPAWKDPRDAEEAAKFAKGIAFKHRMKFVELLRKQEDKSLLITELVKMSCLIPGFHIPYQTAKDHIEQLERAGIVEVVETILPAKGRGRRTLQLKVTLVKDVKILYKDILI